jgi:hypothetical protein
MNVPGRQGSEEFESAEEELSRLPVAVDGIPDTAAIKGELVHHTHTHCVAETEQWQLTASEIASALDNRVRKPTSYTLISSTHKPCNASEENSPSTEGRA